MITSVEQVDTALAGKLVGLVIDDVTIPVLFINPEGEFQAETYPSIVIYRSGIYPDNNRWTNDKFYDDIVELVSGEITAAVRDAPVPYLVYYGVRLYYDYQQDGVALNNHLLKILKRGQFLTVLGDNYDIEFVSYKNPSATYREFGIVKGNEKVEFIDQYLFRIPIDIDDSTRSIITINTQGVQINTTNKEG